MQQVAENKKHNAIGVIIQILIAVLNALANIFGSTAKVIGLSFSR